MKKTFRNFILFSIASAFILTGSCKKYPDGPLLNFQSKLKRLVGVWDVEYFEINGYDSTSYLKSKPYYGMYRFIKEPGEVNYYFNYENDNGYLNSGNWGFHNKKNDVQVGLTPLTQFLDHLGPYRACENIMWEIRKLTEKELWLKTTYKDGRTYLVKFKLFKRFH